MDEQPTPGVLKRAIGWYYVPGPKSWPSSLSIAAPSLYMLFGILVLRWDVFAIMFLYWAENLALGFYHALRMAFVCKGGASKLLYVPFFCLHYGFYCFAHLIFVIGIFGGVLKPGPNPLAPMVDALMRFHLLKALTCVLDYSPWIGISLLLIFITQGVTFIRRDVLQGEYYMEEAALELFNAPYGRIAKLHLALILGGWLAMFTGSSRLIMCVIILAKMLYDWRVDWVERMKPEPSIESAANLAKPKQIPRSRRRKGQVNI